MKIIVSIITLFIITSGAFAQQDKKAKAILDQLSNTTKAHKTIIAKFTSTAVNKEANMNEVYKGQLWQKGDKYKLDFMDATTFFNGKNKWVYMPDVQEVNLFDVVEGEETDNIFDNPQKVFTIYEEGFKYLYTGEKQFNGQATHEIELIPMDTKKEYFKIKLYVNKAKTQIIGFKYYAKDGTRVNVTIDSFKVDEKLKNSIFTFDKKEFPDAELIDMRE
jgi:outer membrane lipoprotein-sorting protein